MGASMVLENIQHSFTLAPTNSVFSAELYAIWKAVEYANTEKINKTLILTDSLSSLTAIQQFQHLHPIVSYIKNELFTANNAKRTIEFMWIPAHVGIARNE